MDSCQLTVGSQQSPPGSYRDGNWQWPISNQERNVDSSSLNLLLNASSILNNLKPSTRLSGKITNKKTAFAKASAVNVPETGLFHDPNTLTRGLHKDPRRYRGSWGFHLLAFECKHSTLTNENPQLSLRVFVPGTGLLHDPDTPTRGLPKDPVPLRGTGLFICLLMRTSSQRFQIKSPGTSCQGLCARDWISYTVPE